MPTIAPIPKKRSTRWHWIWFMYTGFLFLDPIFEHSTLCWSVTLAAFVLFIAIYAAYIRGVELHTNLRFWMIGATFLLGMVVFPINEGASTFFIYTAALLPFNLASLRRILFLFFAEIFIVLTEGLFFTTRHGLLHVSRPNIFITLIIMGMVGGANIFFAQQSLADCQLRAALEENLALAAIAERERIARDLHDVLGHTLSVIVLKAELANRLLSASTPDTTRAATEVADIERITRTALSEVREAIGGYRARGLAAEIEAARLTLDIAGVTLLLDSGPTPAAALTAQEETALALALREAVTNIVRHSRATTCRLRFVTEDNQRRLIIEDNGVDPSSSSPPIPIREGNGIRGMRQRIESLGGHLTLHHGNGTRLLIELPLAESSLNLHEAAAS